jgi:hypothetical protein
MNMLGHDHIANNDKVVSPPNLFQYSQQQVAMLPLAEHRHALITTGGDEVEIPRTIVATKFVGHEQDLSMDAETLL